MSPTRLPSPGVSRASVDAYPGRRHVRSPAGRIASIAVWTLATAAIVAGIATESIVAILAGLVAWIVAMGAVNVVGGGLNAMRTEELDEREVRQRERAFAFGHRAMSGALLALVVASAVIEGDVADATFSATLAGVALLHLATPSLLLALRARLPEPHYGDA